MSKVKRRLVSPTRRRKSKSPRSITKKNRRRSRGSKTIKKTLFKSPYNGEKCQIDLVKRAIYAASSQAKAQGILDWNVDPTRVANEVGLFFNAVSQQGGMKKKPPTQKDVDELQAEIDQLKSKKQYVAKDLGKPCTWDQMIGALLIICLMAWGGIETVLWACAKEGTKIETLQSAITNQFSRKISGMVDIAEASTHLNNGSIFKEAFNMLYEQMTNFFYVKGVDAEIARFTGQDPSESSLRKAIIILARRICSILPEKTVSYPFTLIWSAVSVLGNKLFGKKKSPPPPADVIGQLQHMDQEELKEVLARMQTDAGIIEAIKDLKQEAQKQKHVPIVKIDEGSPNKKHSSKKHSKTKKSHSHSLSGSKSSKEASPTCSNFCIAKKNRIKRRNPVVFLLRLV